MQDSRTDEQRLSGMPIDYFVMRVALLNELLNGVMESATRPEADKELSAANRDTMRQLSGSLVDITLHAQGEVVDVLALSEDTQKDITAALYSYHDQMLELFVVMSPMESLMQSLFGPPQ